MNAVATAEWRNYWPLVLACALGASLSVNAIAHLGVFIGPLEREFGWERAQISAGLTIYAIGGIICAPIVGAMVDRWGPRPIGLAAVALDGLSFAFFGTVTDSIVHWLLLWVVFALASQGTRMLVWYAAVSDRFRASRGLAIAATTAGASFGSATSPVVADFLISSLGWRNAYFCMGLTWGGLVWIACYFLLRTRPQAPAPDRPQEPESVKPLEGLSAKEAILSARFAKIALTVVCFDLIFVALNVHMVPLLTSKGLSASEAAWLVGIGSLGGMAGLFVSGILVARLPGHILGCAIPLLAIIACALLLQPNATLAARFVAAFLLYAATSMEGHLFAYVTSRYFGLRAFGFVYGLIGSFMAIAIGAGPVLAGYVFDQRGSYDLILIAGIPVAAIASILMYSLGRYPDWSG